MTENRASAGKLKLKRTIYEKELRELQIELCRLQDWVKHKGLRVIVVFEGRDAAGKGGTIKAITDRVSPRVFHRRAGKSRKCTSSATFRIFPRPVRSSSSIAVGTTALASSTSWDFAPKRSIGNF